jgi:hypothetical protein
MSQAIPHVVNLGVESFVSALAENDSPMFISIGGRRRTAIWPG